MTYPGALRSFGAGDEWHRRTVLLAIGALLVLSTGPVFGHHVADVGSSLLTGVDHLGTFCVAALQTLLDPVHSGFHLVIIAGLLFQLVEKPELFIHIHLKRGTYGFCECAGPPFKGG